MIDINLFRTPEGIEQVKKSEKNRFKDVSVVDKIVEMDLERIKTQYEYEQICKRINYNLKQIGQNMKKYQYTKQRMGIKLFANFSVENCQSKSNHFRNL